MTNEEILEEVYRIAKKHCSDAVNDSTHNHTAKLVSSFIEQEWQKQDDAVPNVFELAERKKQIGEDGTVKERK